jgi:hypothetical protein
LRSAGKGSLKAAQEDLGSTPLQDLHRYSYSASSGRKYTEGLGS